MVLPDLAEELTHHIGLEPQAQYLLAALLTGRPVHGGGQRLPASPAGARLIRELTGVRSEHRPDVVADLTLRAAPDAGLPKGATPDFAMFWPGRLVLVEVKTDHAAERPGQIARYAALGRHHYPKLAIDLLYITRDPTTEAAPTGVGWRSMLWIDVAVAVRKVFSDATNPRDRSVAETYAEWLARYVRPMFLTQASLDGADVEPRQHRGEPDVGRAVALAGSVAERGGSAVYEYPWENVEDAHAFKTVVLAAMPENLTSSVTWWVWTPASMGRPRTRAGASTGVELRVSKRRR